MCKATATARGRAGVSAGMGVSASTSVCMPLRRIREWVGTYIEGICLIDDAP